MELIDVSHPISSDKQGAVVALGTFDGMHREDQRVVARASDIATATGAVAAVLLFEPHPRRLLHPQQPPFNLMTTDQRRRLLADSGIRRVYTGLFSPALAALPALDFVQQMMRGVLSASHVCASTRVQFGHGEADRSAFLDALRNNYQERFVTIDPEYDSDGRYIASTDIRLALQLGDLASARRMMGRSYAIEGPVIHGAKLGRTIGFPTLNVPLGEYLRPTLGIYASVTALSDGRRLPGVSYIGRRPTVHGVEELLETFLFDFAETIYGQTVETELIKFLRCDETFDGLEQMRHQIALDCDEARAVLNNFVRHS